MSRSIHDLQVDMLPPYSVEAIDYVAKVGQALTRPKPVSNVDPPTEEQMESWMRIISRMNADTIAPVSCKRRRVVT